MQAFGFSYYYKEFIHDCFNIYGLDYENILCKGKTLDEVTDIITAQIQKGYPVIIQNKEHNANFLFITGYVTKSKVIKVHEFMEGFDEKNCNMNPYEMENMDNWLKPDMELLLIKHTDEKLSVEQACKNAIYNYCLLMTGILEKEAFVGYKTSNFFANFMGYGDEIYNKWIEHLKKEEKENVDSLKSFSPQDCILYESNFRTMGFLNMCKQYIVDIDKHCINAAIDRYKILCEHSQEILSIMAGKSLEDKTIEEKRKTIINYLTRSNEIFGDVVNEIKKSINFTV